MDGSVDKCPPMTIVSRPILADVLDLSRGTLSRLTRGFRHGGVRLRPRYTDGQPASGSATAHRMDGMSTLQGYGHEASDSDCCSGR
jgi:hypothetical protein